MGLCDLALPVCGGGPFLCPPASFSHTSLGFRWHLIWEMYILRRMGTSASAVLATWARIAKSAMAATPAPAVTLASVWTSRRATRAVLSSVSVLMVSSVCHYNFINVFGFRKKFTSLNMLMCMVDGPPLWSIGQSSWLQIQRSRVSNGVHSASWE
jgi:hypothetical protein